LLGGFEYAPYGDLEAMATLIDDQTCAILVEPIQGEGGVQIPPDEFLPGLRKLADKHGVLLIFDEVQSGCGRTGKWFAYEHAGVTPDVMTLAKSLCGGIAGAALLATAEVAPSLRPGMHAATFGGNPIAARAGIATLETIEEEGLLARAAQIGGQFRKRLEPLIEETGGVKEVRVRGAMIGVQLTVDGTPIVQQCLERGLLVNCTQQTVIRLLPALTLSDEQLNDGCDILVDVIRTNCAGQARRV
jgi:acetylornithine/succinyldiaminopimelate/putrescine aminotransferase